MTAAKALFEETEATQSERELDYPLLYAIDGYRYCDLLLTLGQAEAVRERARQTLAWVTPQNWFLDTALDHLSLGRAALVLGGGTRPAANSTRPKCLPWGGK
jgi:uncharacterized protein (UPF0548 family)